MKTNKLLKFWGPVVTIGIPALTQVKNEIVYTICLCGIISIAIIIVVSALMERNFRDEQ
jgi:hypothetical protein